MIDIYNILDKEKSTDSHYVIRDGVKEIPDGAFFGFDIFLCGKHIGQTKVFPNGGNEIENIIYGFRDLTSIEIPNSVTSIGDHAFKECTGLTSIEIPDSVIEIGHGAFADCSALKSIYVGSENSSFFSLDGVLYDKSSSSILCFPGDKKGFFKIPDSVTKIGWEAFSGCSGLTSIEIPNSVTYIDAFAFTGCSNLTNIEIPDSVTEIDDGAFRDCRSLTSIEIPNSVTYIADGTFEGCRGLTSIEIPNSVAYIGEDAFVGCSGLTSIKIPNSVTEIGDQAFLDCSGLTSIEIPNSVTKIWSCAFKGCTGLTSIEIPNSVTEIGYSAFSGCTSLTSIHCRISHIENVKISEDAFDFPVSNCTLYVPVGTGYAYRHHPVFSKFKEVVIER